MPVSLAQHLQGLFGNRRREIDTHLQHVVPYAQQTAKIAEQNSINMKSDAALTSALTSADALDDTDRSYFQDAITNRTMPPEAIANEIQNRNQKNKTKRSLISMVDADPYIDQETKSAYKARIQSGAEDYNLLQDEIKTTGTSKETIAISRAKFKNESGYEYNDNLTLAENTEAAELKGKELQRTQWTPEAQDTYSKAIANGTPTLQAHTAANTVNTALTTALKELPTPDFETFKTKITGMTDPAAIALEYKNIKTRSDVMSQAAEALPAKEYEDFKKSIPENATPEQLTQAFTNAKRTFSLSEESRKEQDAISRHITQFKLDQKLKDEELSIKTPKDPKTGDVTIIFAISNGTVQRYPAAFNGKTWKAQDPKTGDYTVDLSKMQVLSRKDGLTFEAKAKGSTGQPGHNGDDGTTTTTTGRDEQGRNTQYAD